MQCAIIPFDLNWPLKCSVETRLRASPHNVRCSFNCILYIFLEGRHGGVGANESVNDIIPRPRPKTPRAG